MGCAYYISRSSFYQSIQDARSLNKANDFKYLIFVIVLSSASMGLAELPNFVALDGSVDNQMTCSMSPSIDKACIEQELAQYEQQAEELMALKMDLELSLGRFRETGSTDFPSYGRHVLIPSVFLTAVSFTPVMTSQRIDEIYGKSYTEASRNLVETMNRNALEKQRLTGEIQKLSAIDFYNLNIELHNADPSAQRLWSEIQGDIAYIEKNGTFKALIHQSKDFNQASIRHKASRFMTDYWFEGDSAKAAEVVEALNQRGLRQIGSLFLNPFISQDLKALNIPQEQMASIDRFVRTEPGILEALADNRKKETLKKIEAALKVSGHPARVAKKIVSILKNDNALSNMSGSRPVLKQLSQMEEIRKQTASQQKNLLRQQIAELQKSEKIARDQMDEIGRQGLAASQERQIRKGKSKRRFVRFLGFSGLAVAASIFWTEKNEYKIPIPEGENPETVLETAIDEIDQELKDLRRKSVQLNDFLLTESSDE